MYTDLECVASNLVNSTKRFKILKRKQGELVISFKLATLSQPNLEEQEDLRKHEVQQTRLFFRCTSSSTSSCCSFTDSDAASQARRKPIPMRLRLAKERSSVVAQESQQQPFFGSKSNSKKTAPREKFLHCGHSFFVCLFCCCCCGLIAGCWSVDRNESLLSVRGCVCVHTSFFGRLLNLFVFARWSAHHFPLFEGENEGKGGNFCLFKCRRIIYVRPNFARVFWIFFFWCQERNSNVI